MNCTIIYQPEHQSIDPAVVAPDGIDGIAFSLNVVRCISDSLVGFSK